jgi:hypothetical protein
MVTEIRGNVTKKIAEPRLVTLDGHESSYSYGEEVSSPVPIKGDKLTSGWTIQTLVTSDRNGHVYLDMTVSLDAVSVPDEFTGALVQSESVRLIREVSLGKPVSAELKSREKDALVVRVDATVNQPPSERTIEAAEKDLKTAEFYRRSGRRDSAQFVYEVILRRYPDTLYATQAKEQIAALKKEELVFPPLKRNPDRVGEIKIINHTKIEDKDILDKLPLRPGAAFATMDILKAETELLRSVKFTNPPRIIIAYNSEIEGEIKDITVNIEE